MLYKIHVYLAAGIAGAVISSTVLSQAAPENYTGPTDDDLALCGINDCPHNNVTNINLEKPADHLVSHPNRHPVTQTVVVLNKMLPWFSDLFHLPPPLAHNLTCRRQINVGIV